MNSWKVILATLVIFGTGVVTGGLLVSYAVHAPIVVPHPNPTPAPPQQTAGATPWLQRARELLRRMDRDLELTPEQHKRMEKLITESADRTKELWKPIAPLMNKEMLKLHREMREELNVDQRKKFDEISKPRIGLKNGRFGTNQPPGIDTNSAPANGASTNL